MPLPIQCSATPTLIAPPPAKAAGFNTLQSGTNFNSLSSIDLADTGNAGFSWYLRSAWPSVANAGVSSPQRDGWITMTPQSASNLSIVNNSYLHTAGNSNPNRESLASACYKATAPGYNGQVFGPGGYYECNMRWNTGQQFGGVAFWMMAAPFLLGNTANFVECDQFENTGSTIWHQGLQAWDTTVNPGTTTGGPFFDLTGYDGNFHTYGVLWQTKAQNGGTGSLKYYVDNALQGTVTYTTEAISVMDTQAFVIFTTAGISDTTFIRVWQP